MQTRSGTKPRPYAHLTVDELRKVEDLTDEEWFDEFRVRGILLAFITLDQRQQTVAASLGFSI